MGLGDLFRPIWMTSMMIKQFKLNNRMGNRVTIDFSSLSEESTTILTLYLRVYFLDIADILGYPFQTANSFDSQF